MKTLRFLQFFVAILVTFNLCSCEVVYTPPGYGQGQGYYSNGGYRGGNGYGGQQGQNRGGPVYIENSPYGPIYHSTSPSGNRSSWSNGPLPIPSPSSPYWPEGADWTYKYNQRPY